MRWAALLLPFLLLPSVQALTIEVEVGEVLHFSLPNLPKNATVTWYTESGESFTGEEFTRQRELEGLRRVTAVAEGPGWMETATFRYYTTQDDWRVYTVSERNFTSLLEIKLSSTSMDVVQVEGRGGVSLISSSPSSIMLSVHPADKDRRHLIFFHLTGEMAGQRSVTGVKWNSTHLGEIGIEEALQGEGEGYTFREEEGYLIVASSGSGSLEILLEGENPKRYIPTGDEGGGGGGDYTLLVVVILAVVGGFVLSKLIIPTRRFRSGPKV
ncbi:MAG: hypothetical protein J7K08_05530 [Thermoplasmata archaeon]|nr:hypothetical protein [Thermoplasmata archaeon]